MSIPMSTGAGQKALQWSSLSDRETPGFCEICHAAANFSKAGDLLSLTSD